MPAAIPEKPSLEGLEEKWSERWERNGTFRFDRTKTRDEIYSIDTPPPTVSGALHAGHVFSFTQTDMLARFWRMRGKEVFYPMGWDDNGLNVERRVELTYGVRCDPTLTFDAGFEAPGELKKGAPKVPCSRPNFIGLCEQLTTELEKSYFDLWTKAALSVDWQRSYTTIGGHATRISQVAFLRELARGQIYSQEAPALWDVDFRTTVAQAEMEDRELPGAYHRLSFHRPDGQASVEIETTRPELVPACVALVAHPSDKRYQPLFGSTVRTPIFGVEVPVLAHELADPEKGSGIAMICTFGDMTDVTWWRELQLPVRNIVGRDGRLVAGDSLEWADDRFRGAYEPLAGLTVKQAQKKMVELLTGSGDLVGDPKPITHAVKFWENGDRPLEIVTTRQWFIRVTDAKETWIERGNELRWIPEFMKVRYDHWVNGLTGDWNISRQRYFGVPFPVWFPVGDDGEVDWDAPILPSEDRLPVDPSSDVPDGYTAEQRGVAGGFVGDPNVMDTWATSSLTPQIVGGWETDPDLFERVFPYDLRPQAHDIIRTWLFDTVVRAEFEHGRLPWRDVAISGFVTDPDRKKLSKSKGNSPDDPNLLIAEYGADGVRYAAASAKLGVDSNLDRNQMKIGRRLAIKLLNASKFVLGLPAAGADGLDEQLIADPVDRSMLAALDAAVAEATTAFENYDYPRALDRIETFFWTFCDDYVELVKSRAYEGDASAGVALRTALSMLHRLLAPFLPYATEEVWSWWQEGSVHRAPWPTTGAGRDGDPAVLAVGSDVLGRVRKAKSDAKVSQRAPVATLQVAASAESLARFEIVRRDVVAAGGVGEVTTVEAEALDVSVTLAEVAPS